MRPLPRYAVFVIFILSVPRVALSADWRIDSATLIAQASGAHMLSVHATKTSIGRSITLSEDVPLDRLSDSFIVGDRFVALGEAGEAQAVIILNLTEMRKEDWFYCYEPRRVGDSWIVYVEYYPSHGSDEPTDVVLLYDAKLGPENNRLPGSSKLAPKPLYPIEVGIPIFPEWNVRNHSYRNVSSDVADAYHVLGPPFFAYLHPDRVAFVVTQGKDMSDYRDFLAVVDLSGNIEEASSRTFPFPKDQLVRPGEHPNFLRVSAIKQIDRYTVQVEVPETVYGVKSISMTIR